MSYPQSFFCDLPEDMPEIARALAAPLPPVLADLVLDYWNPWPYIYSRTVISALKIAMAEFKAREAQYPSNPGYYANAIEFSDIYEHIRATVAVYGPSSDLTEIRAQRLKAERAISSLLEARARGIREPIRRRLSKAIFSLIPIRGAPILRYGRRHPWGGHIMPSRSRNFIVVPAPWTRRGQYWDGSQFMAEPGAFV